MTDSDRLVRLCRPPSWAGVMLAAALACASPALAQDKPSLKELLGRAQSQSEKRAVEDLIQKLQGQQPARHPRSDAETDAKVVAPVPRNDASPSGEIGRATGAESERTETEDRRPSTAATPDEKADDVTTAKATPPDNDARQIEGGKPDEAKQMSAAPDAAPKDGEVQRPSVDLEVLFEFDSARMTPQAIEALTTLGRALTDARLAGDAFLIGGHTDAKGRRDYNLDLSERRAQAVRRFLIDNFGIDGSRLVAKGFGEQHLKNPREPRAAENRRVQIVNVSKQAAR